MSYAVNRLFDRVSNLIYEVHLRKCPQCTDLKGLEFRGHSGPMEDPERNMLYVTAWYGCRWCGYAETKRFEENLEC